MERPPQRPLNEEVVSVLTRLAGEESPLNPDAKANAKSIIDGTSRQLNDRLAEALLQAQKDGEFGPDATASMRSLLEGSKYEGQV